MATALMMKTTRFPRTDLRSTSVCWKRPPGAVACVVAIMLGSPLLANTAPAGSIQGRVLHAASGSYLNNVRVALEGSGRDTTTDETGRFRFAGVPSGRVRLAATYTGFESAGLTLEVPPGGVAYGDIELRRTIEGSDAPVVTLGAYTVSERELTAQAVALHERRNAPNIKNVVAIDVDTGEGNLGEFLKYIPGIGIDQSPQSPQFASVRGMPASGTLVTMNGMEMASNSYTSGRETDLGVAATGNIDRIEVTKVPTPDMPANAVGGGINLVTKSGFSRRSPQLSYNFYGTLTQLDGLSGPTPDFGRSGGPDEKSDIPRVNPSLNLTYLHPFNRNFAVAASFSHSRRYSDWDYRRPIWDKVNLRLTSNSMNALAVGEGKLLAATTLDWRLNEQHALSLNVSHSRQDIFVRQNVITSTFGANATGGPTFVQGSAAGVGTATMDPIWNNQLKTLDVYALTYRYHADGWKADASASFSQVQTHFMDLEKGFFNRAAGTTIPNLILRNDQIDTVGARLTPVVTATNRTGAPVDIHDARLYSVPAGSSAASTLNNEGRRVALNLGREFPGPVSFSLRAGGSFNRTRNRAEGGNRTWAFNPPGGAAGRLAGNHDLIADKFSARSHFTDAQGRDVKVNWLSLAKLKALYDARPDWFTY
ncbi:MAG: carboxypeptidase regulatory-like domain-containing protein, partial [Opitutaceae bacterium]|nr:carboxypeptidase regulatory-like domain-containing protein [Opitutaceae bacterium]